MTWIDKAMGGNASWSRTRLADKITAKSITDIDEMRSLAFEDRLGLCDYSSYSPLNTTVSNASDIEYDCRWLLVVESSNEAVIVNGYISPAIVLLTLITNSLVCAVLLQSHMRTPTNIFLLGLAVSDSLTGVVPLPVFIYFYTFGAYWSMLVPPSWCHVYMPMRVHLPTTWHTASIWLTVGLAFQRYVYICHQSVAKRLCTVRNAVIAVVAVYAAAVASQLFRHIEGRYEPISLSVALGPVDVEDSEAERINITGCYVLPLLGHHNELYLSTYW